jgi:hypothetical protein
MRNRDCVIMTFFRPTDPAGRIPQRQYAVQYFQEAIE